MRPIVYSLGITMIGLVATGLWGGSAANASGLHPIPDLAARVAAFAGRAGRIDSRLLLPDCPRPALAMADPDVVRVECIQPAWTLFVPLASDRSSTPGAMRSPPVIRRGDRVLVAAGGAGFEVTLDATADRDAADGRVWLKGDNGRRFVGQLTPDGRVSLGRSSSGN
ncbi:flagella basal body P-ring formation protein FlgA [Sandarakinorhabdus sp.]|uniref:flagella basal body P-ring formation protein FlgA n=1 Tax=Sandarakinorhabdus sp. TaxID=1916663 RepID=UPI00286D9961|nr:flagella basal body P-ring formation protein FlgA [Sandarakinorhabdus sp.]